MSQEPPVYGSMEEQDRKWYNAGTLKREASVLATLHASNQAQSGPPLNIMRWIDKNYDTDREDTFPARGLKRTKAFDECAKEARSPKRQRS